MGTDKNFKVFFGDIWSTQSEPTAADGRRLPAVSRPKDVVILLTDKEPIDEAYPDVYVAPISEQIEMACDKDLILQAFENPLGLPILIELWNAQPMLKQNLGELRGYLSKETANQLKRFHLSLNTGGIDISELSTGTPILSETDPRIEFHRREFKDTHYLRHPVDLLLAMRGEQLKQTVTQWESQRGAPGKTEPTEISLPPQQVHRIRNWTKKEPALPSYTSQLRDKELALSAFMEALTTHQIETYPDEWNFDRQFRVKPILRFDVSPARSTLLDIGVISINGWWVDVRSIPIRKGVLADDVILLNRVAFESAYAADFYVGMELEKSDDGGVVAKIKGYLTHKDVETLKLGYDQRYDCVELEHFLPLPRLWTEIAEKRTLEREQELIGEELDFQSLDLEVPIIDLPEAVYLRLLTSERAAEAYIEAKQRWEAEIDGWQVGQIEKAEALEKIAAVNLFAAVVANWVAKAQHQGAEAVLRSATAVSLVAAHRAVHRQGVGIMADITGADVIDLQTGELIKEATSRVRYSGENTELTVWGLPKHLHERKFRVLFFDEAIGRQIRELFLAADLPKIDAQDPHESLAGVKKEALSGLLEKIVTVVPQYADIPAGQDTVSDFGSITLTLNLPEDAGGLPEDRFLVLIA